MIRGYKEELSKTYENIREEQSKKLINKRSEIEKNIPKIIDIESELKKISIRLSIAILKGTNEDSISKIREKINNLKNEKNQLLSSNGYSTNYLNLQFDCDKCKDTGFIKNSKCSCYKNKLIKLYYKDSQLEDAMKLNNFSNFDISLFKDYKTNETDKLTPKEKIEKVTSYIKSKYIPNFNDINTNLLFYGSPGSGKTFLSCCIAKELLDKETLVIYKTSDELIQDLKNIKFNDEKELENLLVNCDLLIIDDLGTELINDLSVTELFNFLNKKLIKRKKMIISTNLPLSSLTKTYNERIQSRIIGEFDLISFLSPDLRILKKQNSINTKKTPNN